MITTARIKTSEFYKLISSVFPLLPSLNSKFIVFEF